MSHDYPCDDPDPAGRRQPVLTHNLKVLSAVSFFQDAASELLYPILPIFLTVTLGAPVAVVGVVEGLAEGAASITKLAAGRIADRRAKRPLIGLGYGLASVGKLLIALAVGWPMVLAGRVVDRLGKGIRGAPRDALLMVGVLPEHRGRVFGFHRFADTSGAVVGPLIGLAGYALLGHRIRPLLVIAVVPAVASVLLVRFVHESRTGQPSHPVPLAQPAAADRTSAALPAAYWRPVMLLITFGLIDFPDALLLLRVNELSHSLPFVVITYVAYNAVYALLSYPSGALADRVGPRLVFSIGLLCFAVAYVGLALIDDRSAVWPLLLIYGGFTAATDGVGKAWISSLVPQASQGRAQGLYQGLTGAAVLVSGVWAGLAWHGTGTVPLLVSGIGASVLLPLFLLPSLTRGRVAQPASR
jgi:MFS family permease